VNFNFNINEVYPGSKARIYTIRYKNEDKSEFRKFLEDFLGNPEIDQIVRRLQNVAERYGLRDDWYRQESRNPKIGRILLDYGLLRLFCIRLENDIIILGYDGEKDSEKPKLIDNPDLMTIVKKLETVYDQISYYIKRNGLTIQEFLELEGK